MKERLMASVLATLLLLTGLFSLPVKAKEQEEISAAAYVLMEAETGTVLLESDGEKQLSCGVMAKLMTAYLAGEQLRSAKELMNKLFGNQKQN